MKTKILSMGAIVWLALISPAWATDILGRWIARGLYLNGMDKWTVVRMLLGETVFNFKVDGTKVTGTVTYPQGEAAISEGEISGDNISFAVKRNVGGEKIKIVYRGRVGLNEIKFTSEVQGETGQRQEFTAKREFQRHNDLPNREPAVSVPPPK
jgi:hypothetical protein